MFEFFGWDYGVDHGTYTEREAVVFLCASVVRDDKHIT